MSRTSVAPHAARPQRVAVPPAAAVVHPNNQLAALPPEVLRTRMEDGALNLLGVAATLRLLEDRLEEERREQTGPLEVLLSDVAGAVRLASVNVDREADAMFKAELFLLRDLADAHRALTSKPARGKGEGR